MRQRSVPLNCYQQLVGILSFSSRMMVARIIHTELNLTLSLFCRFDKYHHITVAVNIFGKSCATRLKSNSNSHVHISSVWSMDRIVQRSDFPLCFRTDAAFESSLVFAIETNTRHFTIVPNFQNETNGNYEQFVRNRVKFDALNNRVKTSHFFPPKQMQFDKLKLRSISGIWISKWFEIETIFIHSNCQMENGYLMFMNSNYFLRILWLEKFSNEKLCSHSGVSVAKCLIPNSHRNGINFDGFFGSVTAHLKNIIDTIGGGLIVPHLDYWQ